MMFKNNKEKISFLIWFIVIYALLLIISISLISNHLMAIQENIIRYLLMNSKINYENYIFTSYCSGIVSIATFLSIILALEIITIRKNIKKKDKARKIKSIIIAIIILFLFNIIRLIIILLFGNISLGLSEIAHYLSWIVMGIVVLLLIRNYAKKNY
ncbi:MAG: hypothetical protein V1824_00275 [archaeon]